MAETEMERTLRVLREMVDRQERAQRETLEAIRRLAGDPEPSPGERISRALAASGDPIEIRDRRRNRGEEGGSL